MSVRAGLLRHRVILQSPAGTRDAMGERVTTWTDVATVWARVRPLSGREAVVAAQQQASTDHVVEIRYLAGVEQSWRVLFGARILVITGILNPEEKNEMLILHCTEGGREE